MRVLYILIVSLAVTLILTPLQALPAERSAGHDTHADSSRSVNARQSTLTDESGLSENNGPNYYYFGDVRISASGLDYSVHDDGWDGPGLGSAYDLTYHFINGTPDLPDTLEEVEIERALNEWAHWVQIGFTETGVMGANRSFDIKFEPIDGPHNILAYGTWPAPSTPEPQAGDLCFDEDETWQIGSDYDLFTVALHVIGHSLGLSTSENPEAVMYEGYNGVHTCLHWDDIAGIRTIYAPVLDTIIVKPDGTGDFPTIQAAINASVGGELILLTNGIFNADGNRDLEYHGKAVTVRSQSGNPDSCIIDCFDATGNAHRGFFFHSSEDSGSVLQEVKIINGDTTIGGGIYCVNSSPTLIDCIIKYNVASQNGGGVYCDSLSSPTFINCTIVHNQAAQGGSGVYCSKNVGSEFINCRIVDNHTSGDGSGVYCEGNSSNAIFINCLIYDNFALQDGGGVCCKGSSSPTFKHCVLSDNSAGVGGGVYCQDSWPTFNSSIIAFSTHGAGIYFRSSLGANIRFCNIYGNTGGNFDFYNGMLYNGPYNIGVISSTNANLDSCDSYKNIYCYPKFANRVACNFRVMDWSRCIGAADSTSPLFPDIEGYTRPNPPWSPDIGAYENFWEVPVVHDSLSDTLCPGIYRVVDDISVELGSSLYLLPGTTFDFYGSLSFSIYDTLSAIGAVNDSIVFTTDTLANPFRWQGLRFYNSTSSGSQLSYCRIENGYAMGSGNEQYGGGVFCDNSSPTFAHCDIINNKADVGGGGISCHNGSGAFFDDCTISSDSADYGGGIYVDMSSYLLFDSCTIINNEATFDGGAVWGSADFMSCIICNNEAINGGAIVSEMGLFEDCIIRYNDAVDGGAVYCSEGAHPDFWRCRIDSNTASSDGGGIFCIQWSSPTFTNCTITDNSALTGSGGGLYCWTGTDTLPKPGFNYCTFSGNSVNFSPLGRRGGGVYCNNSPPIFNSTIIAFSNGEGIYFQSSPGCSVAYCDIYGNNPVDIGNPGQGPTPSVGPPLIRTNANGDPCDWYFNIFRDPVFADTGWGDFRLDDSSRCIGAAQATGLGDDIERNPRPDPSGSLPDIGAFESPLAVPVGPLCGRLNGTLGPATYHVSCSLYVVAGDTLTVLPPTTFIFDGYYQFDINGTLLAEGTETDSIIFTTDTLANPSRWQGLRFHNPSSDGSQLAYCLIEYGLASGSIPFNRGGGVRCDSSASPTFSNCTIRFNSAIGSVSLGGGVYCEGNATPQFTDCRIDSNSAVGGGGCSILGSFSTFTNCTFSGNTASNMGGGMYCESSSPPIDNCTFDNNIATSSGGGIYCNGSSPPFTNCSILNNHSNDAGGGIYCYNYSPSFTGCTVADNSAVGNGGGVYCATNATPNFANCTIGFNSAGVNGGGVFCWILAMPVFNSSIIAFSTGSGIHFEMINQGSTVQYCDIFGNSGGDIVNPAYGPTGIGQITTTNFNGDPCDQYYNIFLDPIFVDLTTRDFHLLANSPCIDGGDPLLPLDPDGTVTDIGKYYYHQNPGGVAESVDDLVITIVADSVVLSWSPVTVDTVGNPITVDYYRIYRDTSSVFLPSGLSLIDSTTTTSFTDSAVLVTSTSAYFYNVTAVSLRRMRSGVSQQYRLPSATRQR